MSMNNNNYRRGSLVWPILLIGIGVVFLLNNLGVISWNVWSMLLRMWPVILVAVGLDLLFGRRSGIGAAIVALVTIGMFAGFFWLLNVSEDVWVGDAVRESLVYEIGGVDEAIVNIDQSIGELLVGSLDEDEALFVSGEVMIGEGENLRKSFDVEDGVAKFNLSSHGQQYYPNWLFLNDGMGEKTWQLDFTQDVPLDFDVNTGVGRTVLDLTDLTISALNVSGGVGEVIVKLPNSGEYTASVDAGVGLIDVQVSENVGVKLHIDGGLGNVSVVGDFHRNGDTYTSDNYENADHKVMIYLDGGVGNIRVTQISD